MDVSTSASETAGGTQWPSDWLRATLGFLALRALSAGPSYGYAIISELERNGFGTIKGGTLYPLLTRYQAAGMVTTEWKAGDGGPGRKYFALTDYGRAELTRLSADWLRFTNLSTHYLGPEAHTKESST
ncbi:PadR family transcriptional regulator [Arthrobacter globiformis]|uniref:PadR family transcriptional regulator n=1 Tax=Arthrobacter globiformis TaxID=1665 RepID=A0A328HI43_ARTGO|nr:PadR family transcriptional regulator [Arthrobacter globiformis]RAM38288.1 PadR family transcriptional regulator [Arthrobacter globiformis]